MRGRDEKGERKIGRERERGRMDGWVIGWMD